MTPDDRIQRVEEKQRVITKDISCILKTWDEFNAEYLPYIQMLAQREKDRAELRKAVIKHGTIVALGAVILFLLNAVSHEIQMIFKAVK